MKRLLQFAGILLCALFLHIVGVRLIPNWSLVLDLMLVVSVSYSLNGNLAEGMFSGLVSGWATDAVTRSPFGFFGLANTIVGFGAAYAAQRVVITRTTGAFNFFALASLAQQVLLFAITQMLMDRPPVPHLTWIIVRMVAVGVVGAMTFQLRRRTQDRYDLWRRTRQTRIRLDG